MQFCFKSDAEVVPNVRSAVETFCREKNVPADTAHKLNLIIEELSLNVAHYGIEDGPVEVYLDLTYHPPLLSLRFRDNGKPFNPLQVPPPDLDLPVEDRPVGGLGVFLVRQLTHNQAYRHRNGWNELDLSLYAAGQ